MTLTISDPDILLYILVFKSVIQQISISALQIFYFFDYHNHNQASSFVLLGLLVLLKFSSVIEINCKIAEHINDTNISLCEYIIPKYLEFIPLIIKVKIGEH